MKFTKEDMDACWQTHQSAYLLDIMNGEYTVEDARDDLESLIGGRFDPRAKKHDGGE